METECIIELIRKSHCCSQVSVLTKNYVTRRGTTRIVDTTGWYWLVGERSPGPRASVPRRDVRSVRRSSSCTRTERGRHPREQRPCKRALQLFRTLQPPCALVARNGPGLQTTPSVGVWCDTTELASDLCPNDENQGTRVESPGHGAKPAGVANRALGPQLTTMGFSWVSPLVVSRGALQDQPHHHPSSCCRYRLANLIAPCPFVCLRDFSTFTKSTST